MSQVKLALQPPPNVDFVIGYPGIPPGARDRPQAAVKGAVEVRVGPQGVKAKWVRVELKKIETLPGGGQANSYYDHVGPSPIHLWQSSEEYKMLLSQDFPFYIRIPESIPPSIALEKGAGIRYELVATVCTLGKKGFFRRRKSLVTTTSAIITIDKHELHSTWPVYSQPDSRRASHDGVHLIIERSHTCFGPGDRVSVMAVVKSDSVHTVILRGFEFALVETTIFRPGPYASGKKGGPDKKTNIIGDQKVPVNATLYGGAQHKAELGCLIPNTHTTTSLNAARHIDITYSIVVMAWLATGQVIKLELPVIVSNWPRSVSLEAVRRIGNAPSLSLQQHAAAVPVVPAMTRSTHAPTSSIVSDDLYTTTKSDGTHGVASSIQYNTAPTNYKSDLKSTLQADEMGYGKPTALPAATIDHSQAETASR
ncbi:hypothetical protein SERLADRAFT_441746 [Serpula lacrymans var. lacrymans S7.9]|uniref:Uncharacterized protein n=1 Tax=Serpula lacrymans var. lacrymans (strain S7.9) TaxID=578457 RepID=F8P7H9_SERL9|nr:uncharacterized protein SERLADRAFT_441746 [Serpula lacrymans var. lacrymans S7.9]EGO21390.1 hypothetical protein SERLADRAFT_441746 [Serpula lacrymans var. lacrymans S7.9]